MTWFSEKMPIFPRCMHGFMSNLIKKSWTDSTRQRRKKEKAIRIFGDFLYCALCTASLWTKIKNQRWKLFGIETLLQSMILTHHLASFWILHRFQIWPKSTVNGPNHMKNDKILTILWLRSLIRPSKLFRTFYKYVSFFLHKSSVVQKSYFGAVAQLTEVLDRRVA